MNASFALAAQWLKTPTTNHPLSKAPGCSSSVQRGWGISAKLLHKGESKRPSILWLQGMQPT